MAAKSAVSTVGWGKHTIKAAEGKAGTCVNIKKDLCKDKANSPNFACFPQKK
jgi:hypothetical protein